MGLFGSALNFLDKNVAQPIEQAGGNFVRGFTESPQQFSIDPQGGQTEAILGNALANNPADAGVTAGAHIVSSAAGQMPHALPFLGAAAGTVSNAAQKVYKAANVIDKVTAPDVGKSLYGSEHTTKIQDALQRNGVINYSQIAQAAHNLYNNIINPTLSSSPKLIKIDTITNSIVDEMRRMKPGLDINQAKTAAASVINDLYSSAKVRQGESPLATSIMPQPGPGGMTIPDMSPSTIKGPAIPGTEQYIRMGGAPAGEAGPPGYLKERQIPHSGEQAPKYAIAGNGSEPYNPSLSEQGNITPSHIDTPSLFNIRQDLNNTDAVKNYFNKNPISDIGDLATVASRNAISKIIQGAHPAIAQATHDYGLLQDAVPSIYKATQDAIKDAENAPSFADKYLPNNILGTQMNPVYNAVHDISTNPVGQKILAGGALIGSGVGAKMGFDHFFNGGTDLQNAQENQGGTNTPSNGVGNTHNNSVTQLGTNSKDGFLQTTDLPQSQGDVRLNGDGSIHIASPSQIKDGTGNIIGIDDNSYNQQVAKIKNDIATQNLIAKKYPKDGVIASQVASTIAADQAQLDSLNTLRSSSSPLNKNYEMATNIVGKTSQALQTLNTKSPSIINLNHQLDSLQNNLDPYYAGLKQQLGTISKSIGGGNLDVKTKAALVSVLKQINQQYAFDYYNSVSTYTGGAGKTPMPTGGGAASNFSPVGNASSGNPPVLPPAQSMPDMMQDKGQMNIQQPQFQNGQPAF